MDKQMKYLNGTVSLQKDLGADTYEAVITTADVDRQGEVVLPIGMQADKYMTNPVVLWAHDYTAPPVARAISLRVTPNGVTSQFVFPPRGQSAKADEIHDLWAGGFINTVSIGFIALAWDESASVPTISSWELLEYSLVPVPANAMALRRGLELMTVEEKEGRVLSARNLELVVAAIEALTALRDAADTGKAMTPAGAGEPNQEGVESKAATIDDVPLTTADPYAVMFTK